MAEARLQIVITAMDKASEKLDQLSRRTERMQRGFKIAGAAAIGMGLAIAAGLGMAIKAAAQEEASAQRMIVAMRNVGIEYDEVRESLEAWIDMQQQKTSVSDTEQRDALASLVRITRDMTKAQDLLVLAMDVAIGTGRDLASANTLIMYALSDNWGMLERYIPALKEAKDEEQKWLMLRELFTGQAEAYGRTLQGQFDLLKNNIGDIKEAIGSVLMPYVMKIIGFFSDLAQRIKEVNPLLLKFGVIGAASAGGLLVLGGSLLLVAGFLPSIVRGLGMMTKALIALRTAAIAANISLGLLAGMASALVAAFAYVGWVIYTSKQSMAELRHESEEYRGSLERQMSILEGATEWWNSLSEAQQWAYTQSFKNREITDELRESIAGMTEDEKTLQVAMIAATVGVENMSEEMKELYGVEAILKGEIGAVTAEIDAQKIAAGEAGGIVHAYAEAILESGEEADIAAEKLGKYVLAMIQSQLVEALTEEALLAYIEAVKEHGAGSEEATEALFKYVDSVELAKDAVTTSERSLKSLDHTVDVVAENVETAAPAWDTYADSVRRAREEYERLQAAMMGAAPAGPPAHPLAGLSFQYGGVVPGPVGVPRLIVAHGGERYLGAGAATMGDVVININHPVIRDEGDIEALTTAIAQKLYEMQRTKQREMGVRF